MNKEKSWGGKRAGAGRKADPSTLIRVKLTTQVRLQELRKHPREPLDAVIRRLLDGDY